MQYDRCGSSLAKKDPRLRTGVPVARTTRSATSSPPPSWRTARPPGWSSRPTARECSRPRGRHARAARARARSRGRRDRTAPDRQARSPRSPATATPPLRPNRRRGRLRLRHRTRRRAPSRPRAMLRRCTPFRPGPAPRNCGTGPEAGVGRPGWPRRRRVRRPWGNARRSATAWCPAEARSFPSCDLSSPNQHGDPRGPPPRPPPAKVRARYTIRSIPHRPPRRRTGCRPEEADSMRGGGGRATARGRSRAQWLRSSEMRSALRLEL